MFVCGDSVLCGQLDVGQTLFSSDSTEEITAEQEQSADFYRSVLGCETIFSHYRLITQKLLPLTLTLK